MNRRAGGGRAVLEDLHDQQLRRRGCAGEGDRAVVSQNIAACNARNVRAVAVGVRYVVVFICIVIGERDLGGEIASARLCVQQGPLGNDLFCIAVILKCFMCGIQTGIQNGDCASCSVIAQRTADICTGHFVR